ncbi:universal stress protein [Streptomyces sp. CRN 30]|uniref:universal stress protein n=1 Tax=Streptomyces sp. CRN 30 TaxID=3075613 RepID=UPI002A7FE387|nr:universal stress protein [Streptomyces sp. CRN 30]
MAWPRRAWLVLGLRADRSGRAALAWAADAAAARDLRLRLVRVPARHPDDAVTDLCERARTAATVVLGAATGPDPVVRRVLAHARCPVVVVNDAPGTADRVPADVLVGVELSWYGRRRPANAVDHAFAEAARLGVGLRALHVWRPPPLGVMDETAAVREYQRLLAALVASRQVLYPEIRARCEVVRGRPARVLRRAAAHASLLVIGAPGRPRPAGRWAGPVVRGTLGRTPCPVAVVPPGYADARRRSLPRAGRLLRRTRATVRRLRVRGR